MTTAAELFALQEIDLALDSATNRLAEIETVLGEAEDLLNARAVVDEKKARLTELKSRQSDLEASDEDIAAKVAGVEEKLYGGTVANPKELSDYQAELKMFKQQIGKIEDDLLATLVEIDRAEADLAQVESFTGTMTTVWEEDQRRLNAEKAELEPEVERLQAQRDTDSTHLDRAALSLYQALRDRRAGVAVSNVERGMCGGCRITLPTSTLKKARAGNELVQCVSCERLLVVS
jgi:predicted  nucleic acid-binding Zn-ribbon protein